MHTFLSRKRPNHCFALLVHDGAVELKSLDGTADESQWFVANLFHCSSALTYLSETFDHEAAPFKIAGVQEYDNWPP